jgi:hypothetical protein
MRYLSLRWSKSRRSITRTSAFVIFTLFFIFFSGDSYSQLPGPKKKAVYKGFPSLVWPKLYDVSYQLASEQFGGLDKPIFSEAAKSLNGKEVTLPGYLVPFDDGALKSNHFMLSSLPINACYFCGGGGPETVVEVFSIKQVTYTDKPVEIKGKLFLNDRDPNQMIYILSSAELLGEVEF